MNTAVANHTSHTPCVTVVVNCFNGEKYLRDALDSVYAQRFSDWEIVFWDNASTDKSLSIASSYDTRVKVYSAENNQPLSAARQLAVERATGSYILFLDCDDLLLPDALATQVRFMEHNPAIALSYAGCEVIGPELQKLGSVVPRAGSGDLLDRLLRRFDIALPTAMIRRSMLLDSGLKFDEPLLFVMEDYSLFLRLAAKYPFAANEEVIARYRIHGSALTNSSMERWHIERLATLDNLCEIDPDLRHRHSDALRLAYAHVSYYRARHHMARGERDLAARELRSIALVRPLYMALYFLAWLPTSAWNTVHRWKEKRQFA